MSEQKKDMQKQEKKSSKPTKLKVLEIGGQPKPQAHLNEAWADAEILHLDAVKDHKPDILCDARDIPVEYWGTFDAVFASHVLEHFPWYEGSAVLEHWAELLKPGGELHIIVPSLEWAARAILSEKVPMSVLPHLYAGQVDEYDIHRTGFTMLLLRKYFDEVNLGVTMARTTPYWIMVLGEPMQAEQHYVVGVKQVV